MANKQRGYVDVKLDKQRRFKFTFNAFCELEDVLGRPLSELSDQSKFKMKDLRALVWAGFLHEDPDLTLEDAGQLIDSAESIEYISQKVSEAVELAMGRTTKQGK